MGLSKLRPRGDELASHDLVYNAQDTGGHHTTPPRTAAAAASLTGDDDALPKGVELRAARAPKHLHHVQRAQLHPRRLDRVVHLRAGRGQGGGMV